MNKQIILVTLDSDKNKPKGYEPHNQSKESVLKRDLTRLLSLQNHSPKNNKGHSLN